MTQNHCQLGLCCSVLILDALIAIITGQITQFGLSTLFYFVFAASFNPLQNERCETSIIRGNFYENWTLDPDTWQLLDRLLTPILNHLFVLNDSILPYENSFKATNWRCVMMNNSKDTVGIRALSYDFFFFPSTFQRGRAANIHKSGIFVAWTKSQHWLVSPETPALGPHDFCCCTTLAAFSEGHSERDVAPVEAGKRPKPAGLYGAAC